MGQCSVYPSQMSMSAIIFAVATGTTISHSLGRQYRPMFSVFFLDIYRCNYVCNSHWHNYSQFLPLWQVVWPVLSLALLDLYFSVATATAISCSLSLWYRPMLSLSFLDVYRYNYVSRGHCHNYFLQPALGVPASPQSIILICLFCSSHWLLAAWACNTGKSSVYRSQMCMLTIMFAVTIS